jgi:cell division protein FtsW
MGETTARWIRVPIIGTFQPSVLGILVLLIYTSNFISSKKNKEITFINFVKKLVLPVSIIIIMILPSNFSTAFIGFAMFLLILFIGGFKMRYIMLIIMYGVGIMMLFFLLVKAFPDKIPNRVATWENRINDFFEDGDKYDYQIEKSKAAISSGGFFGQGPGKSMQKHFLPQSNTDFIFSVIVEEYGFIGALFIIGLYLVLLFRVVIIVSKSEKKAQKLLAIASVMPIMFSAFINMGVSTNILPITGQTLPFISSGGTSIIVYSMGIGIILSVSREIKEEREIIKLDED